MISSVDECRIGVSASIATFRVEESSQIVIQKIADPLNAEIRRRILGNALQIQGIVTLAGEDGSDAPAPDVLDRRQDSDLVIDQDVMLGRVAMLYVVKLKFFMDIDENVFPHRLEKA